MDICQPTMERWTLSGSPSPKTSLATCLPTSTGIVYTPSTQEFSSISLPRWRVPWYSRMVLPLFWIIKYLYLSMQRSKNFHSPLETSTERIELNCVQYLLRCMYIYKTNVSLCTTYNVSIHVFDTLLHVFLVNICTWVIFFIHIYRS